MSYRYGPDRYKDGSLVNHWVEPSAGAPSSEMVDRVARRICCPGGCVRVHDPRYFSQLPCNAPTYISVARAAIDEALK